METGENNLPRRLGRYEVVGRIALGGMAEILLGRLKGPSGFQRAVVIKRILPQFIQQASFVEMFHDEARIAARISHPNVVQVQELTASEEELFLVMELLHGEAAAGLLRRARARRQQLEPWLGAHIVAEACAGLHAAHELRDDDGNLLELVHRDVSPQNIFVGYDGTVKVLDFGIAQARDRITQTETGVLKGKLGYMSPEQAEGQELDRRSDLFSLGVVLYELTTQHRLLKRRTQAATLRALIDDAIVPPTTIVDDYPAVLEPICMRALRRDPNERYATTQEMRRDLLHAVSLLAPTPAPDEALSKLMNQLFAGRIKEKQEMVSALQKPAATLVIPLADVDTEVDLPEVQTKCMDTRLVTPPKRSNRLPLLLALAVLIAGVGLVVWPEPAAKETAAVPAQVPVKTAPVKEVIQVSVESVPSKAQVFIGGNTRGSTPLVLQLNKRSDKVTIRLEKKGYKPVSERITPDIDQRLLLVLRRRGRKVTKKKPSKEPSRDFRRFD